MSLITELWEAGIRAEHSYKNNAKILNQFQYCEEREIPFAIIIGEDELKQGLVKFKNLKTREEVRRSSVSAHLAFFIQLLINPF